MAHTKESLSDLTKAGLTELAIELEVPDWSQRWTKDKMVAAILYKQANDTGPLACDEPCETTCDKDDCCNEEVDQILSDVRSAWLSGVKIAQVATSCETIQAAVEAHLTDAEKLQIQWGCEAGGAVR